MEYPASWDFRERPRFQGVFTGRIDTVPTGHGHTPVAYFLWENDQGELEERSIWLGSKPLLEKLSQLAPVKGERTVIKFLGERYSRNDTTYQTYSVRCPDREVNEVPL